MKTALLIASCDKYSDLWAPYFHLLERHWPDCPYKIYLGTDAYTFLPRKVPLTIIRSGVQRSWSRQVTQYLKSIPEEIVLFSLEDFFLRKRVDTSLIFQAHRWFLAHPEAASLRLNPLPPPDTMLEHATWVGEYSARIKYRISTQAAFWRKPVLLQLLQGDLSPWQFELNGQNADQSYRHFGARHSILPYRGVITHHVVEKGQWLPHEVRWLRREGLLPIELTRTIMPWPRYLGYLTRVFGSRLMGRLRISL